VESSIDHVVTIWSRILRAAARRFIQDEIPARAAQMSYYFFLSLFPIALILMTVLGIFLDAQWLVREAVLDRLAAVAPASIVRVLTRLLDHLADHSPGPLTVGLLVALWAASSGMVATIRGLNLAYDVSEERPWWQRRLVGLVLTIAYMVLLSLAMLLLAYGAPVAEALAQWWGLGPSFVKIWQFAQWPVVFAFILLAFDILYHFAPHKPRERWRWIQPGTLVAITLWLLASVCLKYYAAKFANYNVVYGSLGAIIVLLLWFYLTSVAILTGAEINARADAYVPDGR
jgi:membrane protein